MWPESIRSLKVSLLSKGIRISEAANHALTGSGKPLSLQEYVTTSGIILRLPQDIYVTAPAFEAFCAFSPHVLDYDDGEYFIRKAGSRMPAQPIPVPSYFDKKTKRGVPYISVGVTHTDRVRVSPVGGCSFACLFCDLPFTVKYSTKHIDDLLETIRVAADDPVLPARHVLISGGVPLPRDEPYMDEVLRTIPAEVSLPVDIMMVPREDIGFIDKLYSWGISTLSFNIELYNQESARTIMVGKYRLSLDFYLKRISKAVEVFGKGQVQSLVIAGLEPEEDTLKGVEALAERGCMPVLSPFRPSEHTVLRDKPTPSVDQLLRIYDKAWTITKKYGLKPGPRCIPCHHNTLTFPDDSGFYVHH